jgi:hypothetical protein
MIIKIRENLQELYRSEYTKNSQYKNNKLSNLKSVNIFTLSIKKEEKLEYIFTNKDSIDERVNMLIFSPVQFELDEEKNLFQITNKKLLKVQWNKYKEKNRSGKNNAFLFLYERLYFKIDLGMEYDLMSNSAHLPFFVDIYDKDLEVGSVIDGMSWVHTPLGLPLKIEYVVDQINIQELTIKGVVSLDEESLIKLIADKQFQQQAKSYHYTRDFTISSDLKSIYDMTTGYLKFSSLKLKIYSEPEEINESVDSIVSFL